MAVRPLRQVMQITTIYVLTYRVSTTMYVSSHTERVPLYMCPHMFVLVFRAAQGLVSNIEV